MKCTQLLLVFFFLVTAGRAQNNLITRQIVRANDSLCSFSDKKAWNTSQVFLNELEYDKINEVFKNNAYADEK
jgi:hypothetical protein